MTLEQKTWEQKRIYLSFEGANTITTVYVNGTEVGSHEGGYSAFRFDITDSILWDQENVIAVLVNNSRTTYIAPLDWEGNFTKFGGIYRDVSLLGASTVIGPKCYGDVKYSAVLAEPHLWNGVNYHQDSDAGGWAMTDEERDADYAMMLEMGVTAVRMAHYQHDAYEYQLCDRLGLIVYTEIPLINRALYNEKDKKDFTVPWQRFSANIKQQLSEMIFQNYNHPSVCFWGISNELYDTDKETSKLYTELCNLASLLDSTRKTIYADNQAEQEHRNRSEAADLVGYNRYDGWYYGKPGGTCSWIAEHQKFDSRPSCISEYGACAAVTQHMDQPKMAVQKMGNPLFLHGMMSFFCRIRQIPLRRLLHLLTAVRKRILLHGRVLEINTWL